MKWASLTTKELQAEAEKGRVIVVPVGSIEQHGAHLPLDTDASLSEYVANAAGQRAGALVTPTLSFGYNQKELGFPGALSLRLETLLHVLRDIGESCTRNGFRHIVFFNSHGQNVSVCASAAQLVNETTDAWCVATNYRTLIPMDVYEDVRESPFPGDAHAGEFETSEKLYIDEEHVQMNLAVDERSFIRTQYVLYDPMKSSTVSLLPRMHRLTESGVVGTPTMASKEKGRKLIEGGIAALAQFLTDFKAAYPLEGWDRSWLKE